MIERNSDQQGITAAIYGARDRLKTPSNGADHCREVAQWFALTAYELLVPCVALLDFDLSKEAGRGLNLALQHPEITQLPNPANGLRTSVEMALTASAPSLLRPARRKTIATYAVSKTDDLIKCALYVKHAGHVHKVIDAYFAAEDGSATFKKKIETAHSEGLARKVFAPMVRSASKLTFL